MSTDKHFNPVINQRLRTIVVSGDLLLLPSYLDSLSNASFRTAGYILGEHIMPVVSNDDFWKLFMLLVRYNTKAFLVTCQKTLAERLSKDAISLHEEGFSLLCNLLSENIIDTQKTIQVLLPEMRSVEEVKFLFFSLKQSEPSQWIPFLLRCRTIFSYYVLFSSLRYIEHDHDQLTRIAYFLMKNSDAMSFNLASLMKAYFGLSELKGTFSLTLKPFELARIETSFDAFQKAMSY